MEQGAFVEGRNIAENILLAQEIMYLMEYASPTKDLAIFNIDMGPLIGSISSFYLLFLFNLVFILDSLLGSELVSKIFPLSLLFNSNLI